MFCIGPWSGASGSAPISGLMTRAGRSSSSLWDVKNRQKNYTMKWSQGLWFINHISNQDVALTTRLITKKRLRRKIVGNSERLETMLLVLFFRLIWFALNTHLRFLYCACMSACLHTGAHRCMGKTRSVSLPRLRSSTATSRTLITCWAGHSAIMRGITLLW